MVSPIWLIAAPLAGGSQLRSVTPRTWTQVSDQWNRSGCHLTVTL